MKKLFLTFTLALMAGLAAMGQQIAVVSASGDTNMCQTLKDALDIAMDGSVIYLPAGGFQIGEKDSIRHRVTIIGVGHKPNSNNVDGNTVISGSLNFNKGSGGSAVMGCYISGDVNIGYDKDTVNNILVKYCNLNSVLVNSDKCTGTVVNQNYLRGTSHFHYAEGTITNNIMYHILYLKGGILKYNIVTYKESSSSNGLLYGSSHCTVANNIFLSTWGSDRTPSNSAVTNNMCGYKIGDDYVRVTDFESVFKDYNNGAVSPTSNFHFTNDYAQYSDIGPYSTEPGSTYFSDSAMPPVPYISFKSIPEQTDRQGNLHVKIRVKASE